MNPTRQLPTYIDKNGDVIDLDSEVKKIGDLNELETTEKSSVVAAINQIKNAVGKPIVIEI